MILTALDQIPQTLRFFHGARCLLLRADRRCLFERSPQAEDTHLETHERGDAVLLMLIRMHVSLIGALGATLNPSGVWLDPSLDLKASRLKKRLLCGTNEELAGDVTNWRELV